MHWTISTLATTALVSYAYARKSLTIPGILTAIGVATVHAYHPWSIFYGLLAAFFLAGTLVTKVKHTYKSTLTTSSTGGSVPTAPHPRTATQVLANSGLTSALIALHAWHLNERLSRAPISLLSHSNDVCLPHPSTTYPSSIRHMLLNLLPYVITSTYAAVSADTFASELGILSAGEPILITALLRGRVLRVARGTNGGISIAGLVASVAGAAIIGFVAVLGLPLCDRNLVAGEALAAHVHTSHVKGLLPSTNQWTLAARGILVLAVTAMGLLGSVLDSLLGAWCQASVVETRTGKIVEGEGGRKVVWVEQKKDNGKKSGRTLLVGHDWLSNNGVNFTMSVGVAVVATIGMISYSSLI